MRRTRNLVPAALLCAVCLALFAGGDALAREQALPSWVEGETFSPRPAMRRTSLTGYTRARRVMDLTSEEQGRVAEVTADVGEALPEGGVFARLDTTFIKISLRRNLAEQKRVQSNLEYLRKEVARYSDLVRKDLSDQSNLDRLHSEASQAEYNLQSLRQDEAELRERLERSVVRGHEGWKVVMRGVEPGTWVRTGDVLGRAGDYSTLLVPYALSPREYQRLMGMDSAPGLYFPDLGEDGLRIQSRIERVSPEFDPETRKINVDLAVSGLPRMRGGLRAELELEMPDPSGTMLVPAASVVERYEEHWLLGADGRRVQVFLLGPGPDRTVRVRTENGGRLTPDRSFQVHPEF
ncbi:efflux RND transporter periplasmic adaptor subunit [Desulfohalovibrio reitneri]|uniref:efflux RND transporter periplasmic adaptor subunit n=1 Tax=Desulfohalovibrio reitneri TaxID=1307759 RepID=UPI00068CF24C|nr:HlyD family efflux transporter periplasmic adaptor subunit [Desulfohalovibrio reitneri]